MIHISPNSLAYPKASKTPGLYRFPLLPPVLVYYCQIYRETVENIILHDIQVVIPHMCIEELKEKNKQNGKYCFTAAEKVQVGDECKSCNEVD